MNSSTASTKEIPVIILAGGMGTRLHSVVGDRPKVLAPIIGRPFLLWVLERLARDGFLRFVLAVGYKAVQIKDCLGDGSRWGWQISYAVEPELLGTAGAIRNTLFAVGVSAECGSPVLVVNGDTYLDVSLRPLVAYHCRHASFATLGLRQVDNVSRFGSVKISQSGRVLSFSEKQPSISVGLVSVGAYVLQPRIFNYIPTGCAISLERETFPCILAANEVVMGMVLDGPFIDIGTVEGYRKMEKYALEHSN